MSFVTVNDVEHKGYIKSRVAWLLVLISSYHCLSAGSTAPVFIVFIFYFIFIMSYTYMLFRILVCVKSKGEILKNAGHFCPWIYNETRPEI